MKHVTLKLRNVLYLFLTLSLLGCSISNDDDRPKEDEEEEISLNQGFIKAKINGISFSAFLNDDSLNTDTVEGELQENAKVSVLSITGASFENSAFKIIGLVIFFETPFNSIVVGTEWDAKDKLTSLNSSPVYGIYGESNGNINTESSSESTDTKQAYVQITAIDRDKKRISGIFNFTAFDEDNNKVNKVTDGVFNKIPY